MADEELLEDTIGSGKEGIEPSAEVVSMVICFVGGEVFLIV